MLFRIWIKFLEQQFRPFKSIASILIRERSFAVPKTSEKNGNCLEITRNYLTDLNVGTPHKNLVLSNLSNEIVQCIKTDFPDSCNCKLPKNAYRTFQRKKGMSVDFNKLRNFTFLNRFIIFSFSENYLKTSFFLISCLDLIGSE